MKKTKYQDPARGVQWKPRLVVWGSSARTPRQEGPGMGPQLFSTIAAFFAMLFELRLIG